MKPSMRITRSFVRSHRLLRDAGLLRVAFTSRSGPPPSSITIASTEGVERVLETDAPMSAKDMIETSGEGGVYTTARTIGGHSVVEFQKHVERLRDMGHDDVARTLRFASRAFREVTGRQREELRFTVYSPLSSPPSLYCHVEALPDPPKSPIKVSIMGETRENPTEKSAAWIAQRKSLEQRLNARDVHEALLTRVRSSDDDTNGVAEVCEGTQTNVFVVDRGGVVWTASDGVLEGTVRKIVLEQCAVNGIPVSLGAPRANDLHHWDAAFLTSTSRLVLPINEIRVPSDSEAFELVARRDGVSYDPVNDELVRSFDVDPHPIVQRIQALVQSSLLRSSERLMD